MADDGAQQQSHKTHRKPRAGRKADKKDAADKKRRGLSNERYNPKAFGFNNPSKQKQQTRMKADKDEKRLHVPLVDRSSEQPPPVLVAVVGPPQSGKSTLIRSLVKHYTRQPLGKEIKGPITVVSGKHRRLTFYECPNDLHAMTDLAKSADLILLLIDGKYGFEMETFEFLNICQIHGFPKIMGILTHLDGSGHAPRSLLVRPAAQPTVPSQLRARCVLQGSSAPRACRRRRSSLRAASGRRSTPVRSCST